MSKTSKELAVFVRKHAFKNHGDEVLTFSLRHAASGSKGNEVESFDTSAINGENVEIYVDSILERAQMDADGLGSKLQRYALMAIVGDAKDGPRYAFRVKGEGDDESDEGGGEDTPDQKGLMQQLMRHNESIMRMFILSTGQTNMTLTSMNQSLGKQVGRMMEERGEYFNKLEEMKGEQHLRDIELMKADTDQQTKQAVIKKLDGIVPVIMHKLAGKTGMPDGQATLVEALADSIAPEQFAELGKVLTAEQQLMLVNLIQDAKKAKEQK